MALQWFTVKKSDNRVAGWSRSSKATVTPADTAEEEFIVATDADIAQHTSLGNQARSEGRAGTILLIAGVLQLPADTRLIFRVASDVTEVDISASETVELTVTRIDGAGDTITSFNNTVQYEILGKILKFVFVSGVSVRTFAPKESGKVIFESYLKAKLEAPLTITFVE